MQLPTKTVDVFFRRFLPERVLEYLMSEGPHSIEDRENQSREWFLSAAESTLGGYSYEEQEHIFDYVRRRCEELAWENRPYGRSATKPDIFPPFYLLIDYGKKMLRFTENGPVCRFDQALEWREGFLRLGQDLFTIASLAYTDAGYRKPATFSWPAIISSDNSIIEEITSGISENHLHLYAGASTFALTWASLMNHPNLILDGGENESQGLERHLQPHESRGLSGNVWSTKRRMMYAAYIRAILFEYMHTGNVEGFAPSEKGAKHTPLKALKTFHARYSTAEYMCVFLEKKASSLRYLFGIPFSQPHSLLPVCLDYAFSGPLLPEAERDWRLLAGERYFLYRCFQGCFSKEFSKDMEWIFYLYLLLKSQFRSEFIQANRTVGFHNFQDYERRKYMLWKDLPEYWYEDYRQALNAPLREEKLRSLEGRLSPGRDPAKDLKLIYGIDFAKLYYDLQEGWNRWRLEYWRPRWGMVNRAEKEPYFYVMHFPKEKDARKPDAPFSCCRHMDYRAKIKQQAIALAKALSNSDYLCERIRGIDACSSEIGCRPEVFAVAFRFLRSFPLSRYRRLMISGAIPKLFFTYHVGEDFLDIADGLRAIDEAVNFLELRRGDRLGHALALGVAPKIHYQTKHGVIVLPKQELLDDLAWILHRSTELNVRIPPNLKGSLSSMAHALFGELYQQFLDKDGGHSGTLRDYYHSMLLRGDAPECCMTGEFRMPRPNGPDDDPNYPLFYLNERGDANETLWHFRNNPRVMSLCMLYQYGAKTKRIGSESTSMEITQDYIRLMEEMQTAMQAMINELGLCIECNPSSNVLIGSFQYYQEHPIFRFHNAGLSFQKPMVQMHVSVNSDDPGVFDTSLPFEYVLLAAALADMKDQDGRRIHTDRQIEDYLRTLVRMGNEQRFRKLR